jgi:hypothetical protein
MALYRAIQRVEGENKETDDRNDKINKDGTQGRKTKSRP